MGGTRINGLPFGAALAGDMFQRKIDEIFKDLPNVFSIADNILVAGYKTDCKDHDETVQRVLQRCRQVNLKIKQRKVSFQVYISPILWANYIVAWSKNQTHKIKALVENPSF